MEDARPNNPIKSDVFLDDLYGVSDDKMPRPSMQSFPQYSRINNDAPIEHMESDIPDRYDTLDIYSSLLDQFDNDNIIELRLGDQINKDPLPHQHNMSDIESNLLDQLDDDSIVELELRDQRNKHPSQWQLASDNDPKPSGFDEIGEVIKASLGFRPKPWQIKGLFDIKQGLDMVIMAGTGSGKSLLFQALPLIIKNAIVLVIMPTLALMKDQCQ